LVLVNYERTFGALPAKKSSPREERDSPEIDQFTELDVDGISLYHALIEELQWAVTLGRFDIMVTVLSMPHYRANPHVGHLERLKRVFHYLRSNLMLESVSGLVFPRMKISLRSLTMFGCIVCMIVMKRFMIGCLYLVASQSI
jgi:hypothetical protein